MAGEDFLKFLIEHGYDKLNSFVYLEQEFKKLYSHTSLDDLEKVYFAFKEMNNILSEEIKYDKYSENDNTISFINFMSTEDTESIFFKSALSIDLKSAHYSVLMNLNEYFPKDMFLTFFTFQTWINKSLKEYRYGDIIRKQLINKMIAMLSKKYGNLHFIRSYVHFVMQNLIFKLRPYAKIIKCIYDGLLLHGHEKTIPVIQSLVKKVNVHVDEIHNLLFFSREKYAFIDDDIVVIKGVPYSEPYLYKFLIKEVLSGRNDFRVIQSEDFMKQVWNEYPEFFVIREKGKGSNNIDVITKEGGKKDYTTNPEIDYQYYINEFNSKYGVFFKGIDKWIH